MAIVSVSKAAELAGVSRITIQRRLKEGSLSEVTQSNGSPGVDTSELIRHYGRLKQKEMVQDIELDVSRSKLLLQREIDLLHEQIKILVGELMNAHQREKEANEREKKLFELLQTKLLSEPREKKKRKKKR